MKTEIPMSCRRLVQTESQLNVKKKFVVAVLNCDCLRFNAAVPQFKPPPPPEKFLQAKH